jgi:hypothetical protein
VTTDRARDAATDFYSERHRRMLLDARQLDRRQMPLSARKVRYRASLIARAALAEELDPEPSRW